MGWGRMLLLGNLGQQMDIDDLETSIRQSKRTMAENARSVEDVQSSVVELQVENDQLKLYLAAVVRILMDKGLTTEADIRRLVQIIDAEDGSADDRRTGGIV